MQIIDADGHVNDRPCMQEISKYMPPGNRTDGEFLSSSRPEVMASEYFCRHVREGRIFVGFDCDDRGLGFAIKEAGNEAFLFATDFPHESFDAKHCRHEINELLAREDIHQADKEAILATNAKKFYGVD